MDLAEPLAEFVAGFSLESLPRDALCFAVEHVTDAVGVMIAGSAAEGLGEALREIRAWGGLEESSIVRSDTRTTAHQAALANAAMGRALDYDDVHEAAMCHTMVGVVPAALAVAEAVGASGREFLAAVAAGAEVEVRIGLAPRMGSHASGMSHTYQSAVAGKTRWRATMGC